MSLLKIIIPALVAFTSSRASSTCLFDDPYRSLKGKFEVVSTQKAELICKWDENLHKIDNKKLVAPGCTVDLKIIRPVDKRRHYPSIISIYTVGSVCNLKVKDRFETKVSRLCCDRGQDASICTEKPTLKLGSGDIKSVTDVACSLHKWVASED